MIDWIKLSGLTKYDKSLQIMEDKLIQIILNRSSETVYLLEHEDVYTAGVSARPEELLKKRSDIPIVYSNRGGKYTYHGPGQSVIYPLINLNNRVKDIKLYIQNLETVTINTLQNFNLKTYTIKGKVGIWTNQKGTHAKLGAIGIRIRKWVTYHGLAINISTELEKYTTIIPCGISNLPVTSLHKLGIKISIDNFNSIFQREFEKIF